MALSLIGDDAVNGASITIPTHQAGDVIILFAYDQSGNVAPVKPAAGGNVPDWVLVANRGGSTNNGSIYYFIATGSSTESGTWTSTTQMAVVVVRGAGTDAPGDPPVHLLSQQDGSVGGSTSNATAPAENMGKADGSSFVFRFHGSRGNTTWSAAPSGFTRLADIASATGGACVNQDDSTAATSVGTCVQGRSASASFIGFTIEVMQATADDTEEPTFDAATVEIRTATTDPYTFTHTPVGAPAAVVVVVNAYTASGDETSAITYGGVALSEVVQAVDTSGEVSNTQVWFLGAGIPTGAQTVSVDLTGAVGTDMQIVCLTYTASGECEVVDQDEVNEDDSSPSVALSHDGRPAAGVVALVHGTPNTPNLEADLEMVTVDGRTDGSGSLVWVARRGVARAADWSPGWVSSAGVDDASMAAILFAAKAASPRHPAIHFQDPALV